MVYISCYLFVTSWMKQPEPQFASKLSQVPRMRWTVGGLLAGLQRLHRMQDAIRQHALRRLPSVQDGRWLLRPRFSTAGGINLHWRRGDIIPPSPPAEHRQRTERRRRCGRSCSSASHREARWVDGAGDRWVGQPRRWRQCLRQSERDHIWRQLEERPYFAGYWDKT